MVVGDEGVRRRVLRRSVVVVVALVFGMLGTQVCCGAAESKRLGSASG
jgi:hypothetical protein